MRLRSNVWKMTKNGSQHKTIDLGECVCNSVSETSQKETFYAQNHIMRGAVIWHVCLPLFNPWRLSEKFIFLGASIFFGFHIFYNFPMNTFGF